MSRRNTGPATPDPQKPEPRTELIPITELPHLAEAAKRLGCTDRLIRVDLPVPPQIKTRNREPGQWLLSGERLPEMPTAWEGFDR